jgi:hypothetical protein
MIFARLRAHRKDNSMKKRSGWMLATALALTGVVRAQSGEMKAGAAGSDMEKFIGAWHLVSMGESGANAKEAAGRKGSLIYTRDGHMSVEIMYPPAESSISNDYVLNGYEASFGSYDVNEEAHTVTHHVQASITRGLVGKDLTRVYRLSGKYLIIKSANPDEHWSVTWEHD